MSNKDISDSLSINLFIIEVSKSNKELLDGYIASLSDIELKDIIQYYLEKSEDPKIIHIFTNQLTLRERNSKINDIINE